MTKIKIIEAVFSITVGMLVFYFIFEKSIFLKIALIVGLVGLFSTHLSHLLALAWYKLAETLGFINTRILLTIIFFTLLVPLAFLSRLFSKNNLQLKRKEKTYFTDRNHCFTPKDFENTF